MSQGIYISAGEVSGEQHAARLVGALRRLDPSLTFTGMGGDILRAGGVDTVVDLSDHGVMGFMEVVRHLPSLGRSFSRALGHIHDTKPKAVVLVDFAGFHLRLARQLKKHDPSIPILYYIAPKVWAWNEGRVDKIRRDVDLLLTILPFEEEWFAERGVRAQYVGNPVRDAVRDFGSPRELRRELGIAPESLLVSLFPGSRPSEVQRILPSLLAAAEKLEARFSDVAFAVSAAPSVTEEFLRGRGEVPDRYRVVRGRSHTLMAASYLLLAKSGTTTLEAALLGVPMVILYRSSWVSAAIARHLVRIPHFSLPNIVAGKQLVPELFQSDATPERIYHEAAALLSDGDAHSRMRGHLLALRERFGEEPADERAARAILDYLH